MLVTLQEYRERFFAPDSRPHMNTIRNWVRGGKLPTEKRGKRIYIQTDKLDQVNGSLFGVSKKPLSHYGVNK